MCDYVCIILGLATHPARVDEHIYTIYGGASQDRGRYVYVIDEHKKLNTIQNFTHESD